MNPFLSFPFLINAIRYIVCMLSFCNHFFICFFHHFKYSFIPNIHSFQIHSIPYHSIPYHKILFIHPRHFNNFLDSPIVLPSILIEQPTGF